MLKNFEGLTKNFKLKPQTFYIDNWIFRMHYRVTALIFFVACIMVTSQQYIGEHIKCISDKGVAEHVMNTFCFFTTTFTLVKDNDDDVVPYDGNEAHPGVGPYGQNSTQPITRHAYYQWVPFLLFGQAIMFMITHLMWKKFEGGRIRRLVQGLEFGAYSLLDKDVTVKVKAESKTIPSKAKKDEAMRLVRRAFIDRIVINRSWSLYLVFCEILNVLHVILQVYITNEFLGKQFLRLGVEVAEQGYESTPSVLDEVFPKLCTGIYEMTVLNALIVVPFTVVAAILFSSAVGAGQAIETETGKFADELYNLRWSTWSKQNLSTFLIIVTVATPAVKLKYSESIYLGHELGFRMVKGMYSVVSVFFSSFHSRKTCITN